MNRVCAYIDGFNFYHAVKDLKKPHLKWVDLYKLCLQFAPRSQYDLHTVYYFSAFATWRPGPYARHRAYVKAQDASGVTVVMGNFKEKYRRCYSCGHKWTAHEEKETDVNIALHLLADSIHDRFDRALVISGDSDIAPAVRMALRERPEKEVRILAPPGRNYSMDLVNAAGGTRNAKKLKETHLEHCLLPATVSLPSGKTVKRPTPYDPPKNVNS